MSSEEESPLPIDKGIDKGKNREQDANPSERTPLLASSSNTSADDVHELPETTSHSRRRFWYKLTLIFLVTLSICIVAFVIIAFLAYSYAARASLLSPDDLLTRAVVVKGPDRLDVLNITLDGGVWVQVEGRMGVDAGAVIGVNSEHDDGVFRDIWKALGRWGVRRLKTVSIQLTTIRITPKDHYSTLLTSVDVPPLSLPLTTEPPADFSWLTTVSIPIFVSPTQNSSVLARFVRESWRDEIVAIQAHVDEVAVRGGSLQEKGWRRKFEQKHSDIHTAIHVKIPPLPGLPPPGPNTPFPSVSDLITLETFGVTSQPDTLSLYARASVVDPAPLSFNFTSPTLPFTIYLPSPANTSLAPLAVASVYTKPFTLTHPNITVHIAGEVLPIPTISTPILSALLTNYLSGRPSPIIITSPYFPSHTIEAFFPGPNPKPKVLRNVTIHNMKMVPRGTTFYASGTVYARAVLPPGLKVTLDVNRVLPDVLVFDGEVPDSPPSWGGGSDPEGSPDPAPLPDPLPERAFARIRPEEWLLSHSVLDEEENDEGSVYTVTAEIVDAPLQVLPNREGDFSRFVRKVVFGTKGAVAGILGTAAVGVDVEGLPNGNGEAGEMELSGLPFQGSVIVGKKGL